MQRCASSSLSTLGIKEKSVIPASAKRIVQQMLDKAGYRIVPHNRDAMSVRRYVRNLPIKAIIDVGANNGATCAEWLATFPAAKVYAIEALERYRPELIRLVERSQGRMRLWQYAASDEASEITFLEHENHPSSSSLLESTDASHELMPFTQAKRVHRIRAMPIDEMFEQEGISLLGPTLMKLDVQGAEEKVLRGSARVLEKVEVVITEVNIIPLYHGQASFESISAILQLAGLRFFGFAEQFHTETGQPIYFDAVFIRR